MRTTIAYMLAILILCGVNNDVYSQEPDSVWQNLKSYFSPPQKYADSFGEYRSPLKFYDGRDVKTPLDWKKRRKEILHRWHDMLGHWPKLIKKDRFGITDSIHQENFTRYTIEFTWRRDEKTKGYLLVPDAEGKKPAVMIVFYEPETAIGLNKPGRDIALQLARRGFVVLSTGTGGGLPKAKPYNNYYPTPDNVTVQPLSMLGYLAANAYNLLENLPYVDAKRIGITGHSYGAKWALFASCLYEKFACAVWSDPGIIFDESNPNINYYAPWYLGYYPPPWSKMITFDKGLYPKLRKEEYDLLELHALMAPRPFLVSGGSEDQPERWIPLNHAIAVNRLLGFENRVGMTNRAEHAPNAASNEQLCLFFEHFLKYNGITKKK